MTTISALPVAGALSATDAIPLVQSGVTKRATPAQVSTYVNDNLPANTLAFNGLAGAADRLAYFTGVGAMALTPLTAVARALLDDTTVAAQRATLGLVLTTSATDTTAGSVLKVGDYGWGAPGNATPTYTVTPASLANTSPSAVVQALTTDVQATVQSPVSGEEFGGVHIARGIRPAQFGVSGRGATASLWFRGYSTASALQADWLKAAKSGANSDITSLTGLTTPLSVAQGGSGGTSQPFTRANSLGTVSQSGGVPTGAVFETGGNLANGKWTKYANGDMVVHRRLSVTTAISTAVGSVFYSGSIAATAFGVTFAGDLPTVQITLEDGLGVTWSSCSSPPTLSNAPAFYLFAPTSTVSRTYTVNITSTGKWF